MIGLHSQACDPRACRRNTPRHRDASTPSRLDHAAREHTCSTTGTFRTRDPSASSLGRQTPVARIRSPQSADLATTATLVVNHVRIALPDAVDTNALIDEVVLAVRSGGAIVHVIGRDGVEYDIVVTTATQALIRYQHAMTDDHAGDGPWLSTLELDY